jgi:hypothetical protein
VDQHGNPLSGAFVAYLSRGGAEDHLTEIKKLIELALVHGRRAAG